MPIDVQPVSKYPEHERVVKAEPQLRLLSEFHDWLLGEGIELAYCEGGVVYETALNALFSRFIGVDLEAFNAEKKSMLDEIIDRVDQKRNRTEAAE